MIMDLMPTPGKLIVKMDEQEEKTFGGIIIPGTAISEGNLATVVARNPLAWHDENGIMHMPTIHPGDRVVVGKYAGVKINYKGEEYVVFNAKEILAVEQMMVPPTESAVFQNQNLHVG